jgi:uncharacterized RDD family membrane protein YckC
MYTETNLPQTEENLFTEQDILAYQDASTGQRFCNFLIDYIVVQYSMAFLAGILIGVILMLVPGELSASYYSNEDSAGVMAFLYLLVFVLDVTYFTLCEKLCNGRTLGKLITGTKAIRNDGTALTWKDAFLRSVSRIVPFEPFSALGGAPWHDSWTQTTVVKWRK